MRTFGMFFALALGTLVALPTSARAQGRPAWAGAGAAQLRPDPEIESRRARSTDRDRSRLPDRRTSNDRWERGDERGDVCAPGLRKKGPAATATQRAPVFGRGASHPSCNGQRNGQAGRQDRKDRGVLLPLPLPDDRRGRSPERTRGADTQRGGLTGWLLGL